MLDDSSTDDVFHALAHRSRRRMLDIVKNNPGIGVGELAVQFDVSRIAVMKHLDVLESAQLVISEKQGRTRKLYFNAAPIQLIHKRWTTDFSAYWAGNLTRIKYLAETGLRLRDKDTAGKKKKGSNNE